MATLDLQVSQSSDDCEREKTSDYFGINSGCFIAGYDTSSYRREGSAMRFLNVTIPAGSIITAAYFSLRALSSSSNTIVKTLIQGQNNNNPATFSTKSDFDARTWLGTIVYWDSIPAWTANQWYNSPDIAAIIQAIINLSGWASGNALVLCWNDFDQRSTQSNNVERIGFPYDGSATYAPKLHIEYTPTGGAVGRSVAYIIG